MVTVAARTPPLVLTWGAPMRFIGRDIVVLPLDPHGPLRALHDALCAALRGAGVRYEATRWPFTPHCTLTLYATLTPESMSSLLAFREREPWRMHTLRAYHTRDNVPPRLLADVPLTGA
jgi:2'-5' RNA ligase